MYTYSHYLLIYYSSTYIHMYICIYTCIQRYMFVTHIYIYIHAYIHTHLYVYVNVYVYMYIKIPIPALSGSLLPWPYFGQEVLWRSGVGPRVWG